MFSRKSCDNVRVLQTILMSDFWINSTVMSQRLLRDEAAAVAEESAVGKNRFIWDWMNQDVLMVHFFSFFRFLRISLWSWVWLKRWPWASIMSPLWSFCSLLFEGQWPTHPFDINRDWQLASTITQLQNQVRLFCKWKPHWSWFSYPLLCLNQDPGLQS